MWRQAPKYLPSSADPRSAVGYKNIARGFR